MDSITMISIKGFRKVALPIAWFLMLAVGSAPGFTQTPPEQQPASPKELLSGIPDRQQRQPRRIPPREAVDACKGKNEGDPCTFTFIGGQREGECLSGQEQIFACRPHQGNEPITEQERDRQPRVDSSPSKPDKVLNRLDATVDRKEPPPSPPAGSTVVPAAAPPVPMPAPQATTVSPSVQETQPVASLPAVGDAGTKTTASPWLILCVAILAAVVTWFAFHRYAMVPLRRLRKVTQQLASGDLSARVGEGIVDRRDEIADLGRDVDRMAERIQNLVTAHQRLIRDVSHELRSPLARLNVALELARQSAGASHAAPFDRIERESERLNELIGQLLLLTKLESDSALNQRVDFNLTTLVADVVHDADFEAQGSNRRVVTTDLESLTLTGSRELIRQALENLVRNAVRYTAEGTSVEISLKKKETGTRKWAHLEVRDYGPGVPESELYDIFRPFYRVNDARERQSGGTGVGLAISDRAVRLHGGNLRAFNAVGCGLTMEMELPLS